MKKSPFVSVIILSYNGSAYLENCLNSVLDQDYPKQDCEIIVADNGSTDNSVSLLKSKYQKNIVLLEFGTNYGFARGNNLAADSAKGELLVFLNQLDIHLFYYDVVLFFYLPYNILEINI